MTAKKWFNIAKSHKAAKEFYDSLDASMTPEKRLEDITFCREQYFIFKGMDPKKISIKKVYKIFNRK